jgi:hypothetical protein
VRRTPSFTGASGGGTKSSTSRDPSSELLAAAALKFAVFKGSGLQAKLSGDHI